MVEIALSVVAFLLVCWAVSLVLKPAGDSVPVPRSLDEQLFDYMAERRLEFLCCEFFVLYLLAIDPKTPGKDLAPEQRSAIADLVPNVEEAAERLVVRGLLKPHEETFQFRETGVTTASKCLTPGLYAVTDAGRRELQRRRTVELAGR